MTNMRIHFISFMILILVSACALQTNVAQDEYLTPRQLNTNADEYDGQVVVVRGYVLLGTNARALYESKERHAQLQKDWEQSKPGFDPADYDDNCLTLLNAKLFWKNWSLLEHETIKVRGTFIKNYLDGTVLDLQACAKPTALVVDQEDLQRTITSLIENPQE